jgi:hypothetical protein
MGTKSPNAAGEQVVIYCNEWRLQQKSSDSLQAADTANNMLMGFDMDQSPCRDPENLAYTTREDGQDIQGRASIIQLCPGYLAIIGAATPTNEVSELTPAELKILQNQYQMNLYEQFGTTELDTYANVATTILHEVSI